MKLLILMIAAFAPLLTWAADTPELISWQRYMMMNVNQRQVYLTEVEKAIRGFEGGQNETITASSWMEDWSETLAWDFSILPTAYGEEDYPADCGRTQFYQMYAGGPVCYKLRSIDPKTNQVSKYGAEKLDCSHGDFIKQQAARCYKEAAQVANDIKPAKDPKNAGAVSTIDGFNSAVSENKAAAAKKEADAQAEKDRVAKEEQQKQDVATRERQAAEDAKPYNKYLKDAAADSKACTLSAKDMPAARKKYRANPKAQCLVGGVISAYNNSTRRCNITQENKCKDKYTKSAKRISSARLTTCNSMLYCKKGKSGGAPNSFCVEASKNTLANCEAAVKSGGDYMFGKDCVGTGEDGHKKWNDFKDQIASLCSPEAGSASDSLLCSDCKNLAKDLQKAEAEAKPPGTPNAAPAESIHSAPSAAPAPAAPAPANDSGFTPTTR